MRIILIFVLGILDSLGTSGGLRFLSLTLVKLMDRGFHCSLLLFGSIGWGFRWFSMSLGLGHWLRFGTHAIVEQIAAFVATRSRLSKGFKLVTLVGVLVHLVVLIHIFSVDQIFVAELPGLSGFLSHLGKRLLDRLRRGVLGEVRDYQLYLICVVLLQQQRMAVPMPQGKRHKCL